MTQWCPQQIILSRPRRQYLGRRRQVKPRTWHKACRWRGGGELFTVDNIVRVVAELSSQIGHLVVVQTPLFCPGNSQLFCNDVNYWREWWLPIPTWGVRTSVYSTTISTTKRGEGGNSLFTFKCSSIFFLMNHPISMLIKWHPNKAEIKRIDGSFFNFPIVQLY